MGTFDANAPDELTSRAEDRVNIKQATSGSMIVMASVLALACACGDEAEEDTSLPGITSVHVDSPTALVATVIVTGPDGIVSQGTFEPAWGEYNYPNGQEGASYCSARRQHAASWTRRRLERAPRRGRQGALRLNQFRNTCE